MTIVYYVILGPSNKVVLCPCLRGKDRPGGVNEVFCITKVRYSYFDAFVSNSAYQFQFPGSNASERYQIAFSTAEWSFPEQL